MSVPWFPDDLEPDGPLETAESVAWAEFRRHASIARKYLTGLEREFCQELARCLDPYVHERLIRSYGAIVCREVPDVSQLGRLLDVAGMAPDVLRACADGRKAMVLCVPGDSLRLLVFREELDTEQDYASLAAWIEGLIVCNHEDGVVRIVTDASVTTVEGRRWNTKDLVFEAAEAVAGTVPAADALVVRRMLELCHHRISPGRMGATLLCLLTDHRDGAEQRDAGVDVAALGLSIHSEDDERLILHQIKYRDGAVVFGPDGRLLRVNVILQPSIASRELVAAAGGTRHTSAAQHTFDRPDVLAFVVSADGLVTVFSDGRRIGELRMRDSHLSSNRDDAKVRSVEIECPSCAVSLAVRVVEGPGSHDTQRAVCPACGRVAYTVEALRADAFMRKTHQTIAALLQLRQTATS